MADALIYDAVTKLANEISTLRSRIDKLELRETLEFTGSWASWTPVLYQAASISSTITSARYCRIGNTIIARCYITSNGTGASGNAIQIRNLPEYGSLTVPYLSLGFGVTIDVAPTYTYISCTSRVSASQSALLYSGCSTGGALSFAVGTSDVFSMAFVYEVR